ncbi:MAG: UDP-N-acetylglucosamine--N-acetylmuramyl-(pentapeptide) pyrophosphoryl-undecaprenol N-acetylglucosamine transferase [Anaerolineae bacterium]|nr:UDP-N-acetylglucosamine--N-acetylmuramyl-(pentapeptide) pyrophosphoryl-undecaprenol N-acetylglucosamine transferase [Anaerolineae bacterium]
MEKELRGESARPSNLRLWIAGGGTGGHVYPGLAVVQALATRATPAAEGNVAPEILYVGGKGKVEEQLAARAGLRFVGVPVGGIHGLPPWQVAWNLTKLAWGWLAVLLMGLRQRPAALFATGGYASVPVALAAWMLRVPILVYLPDMEPGWAVRFVARLAARVGVTVEEAAAHFPAHKAVVTGYPVRAEFHSVDRAEARSAFGLTLDEAPVLLVMGGSTGAQGINRPFCEMLEQGLELAQVIHVTGKIDWPWIQERREALPAALHARYQIHDYVHDMGKAFAAADLVVCRAGASILGELPFFGLPAVLVPYPHAWEYQRVNADWLAERGAAVRLQEERLGEELLPTLRRLLGEREARAAMAEHMQALARPDAAARLAGELLALAQAGGGRGV